jgi:phage shock protein A
MLIIFPSQGSTDTEFVDYLLDIQLRAHNLHLRMESTFEDTRSAMSEASEELIESVLGEILEANHRIDEMVQIVGVAVAEANATGMSMRIKKKILAVKFISRHEDLKNGFKNGGLAQNV